jgi:hypothetical protein
LPFTLHGVGLAFFYIVKIQYTSPQSAAHNNHNSGSNAANLLTSQQEYQNNRYE